MQPGWDRYTGTHTDGKLVLKKNQVTITYTLNADGTMSSLFERPGVKAMALLVGLGE